MLLNVKVIGQRSRSQDRIPH